MEKEALLGEKVMKEKNKREETENTKYKKNWLIVSVKEVYWEQQTKHLDYKMDSDGILPTKHEELDLMLQEALKVFHDIPNMIQAAPRK